MLHTDAVDDAPSRVARLTGAEIAEMILRTDAAVYRDRAMQPRYARLGRSQASREQCGDYVCMVAGRHR